MEYRTKYVTNGEHGGEHAGLQRFDRDLCDQIIVLIMTETMQCRWSIVLNMIPMASMQSSSGLTETSVIRLLY